MKKTIYAISVVLLLGALIIQSVWGAQAKPAQPAQPPVGSRLLS